LDFLGTGLFRPWNPSIQGLEKLGFPWNLSCEMSLFNRLCEIFAKNIFAWAFPALKAPDGEHDGRCDGEEQNRSWAEFSRISVFVNQFSSDILVVRKILAQTILPRNPDNGRQK